MGNFRDFARQGISQGKVRVYSKNFRFGDILARIL